MKIFSLVALAAIATIGSADTAATVLSTSPVIETPSPTTMTPAPTTSAPVTTPTPTPTTVAPTSSTPVTTTPATTATGSVTVSPTSTAPASTTDTPAPTATGIASQTPTSSAPESTTQAPTGSDAPPSADSNSTTPVPTATDLSGDSNATMTPVPTTTEPVTTTPVPTTTEPATTTPAPTSTEPTTTTPAPTSTEAAATTPAPTSTDPATTTPTPTTTSIVTSTPTSPVPTTSSPTTSPTTSVPTTTAAVATTAPSPTKPTVTKPTVAKPSSKPTPAPRPPVTRAPVTPPAPTPAPKPVTPAPKPVTPAPKPVTLLPGLPPLPPSIANAVAAAIAAMKARQTPAPTTKAPTPKPAPLVPPVFSWGAKPTWPTPSPTPTPTPTTQRPATPPPTIPVPTTQAPTARPRAQVRLGVVGGNASMVVDEPVLFTCYNIYGINQCPASGFNTMDISKLNFTPNANGSAVSILAYTDIGCSMDKFLTMSRDDQSLTFSKGMVRSFIVQAGPKHLMTDSEFGVCSVLPTIPTSMPTPVPTTPPASTPRPRVQVKLGVTGGEASMVLDNPVLYTCYNIYELNNCPGTGFDIVSNANLSFTPGANVTGLNVRLRLFSQASCNSGNALGINIDGETRTVSSGMIKSFIVDDGGGLVKDFTFGQCVALPTTPALTPAPTTPEPPSPAPASGLAGALVDMRMSLWGDVVVVNEPKLHTCYNIDQCSSAGFDYNVMRSSGLIQAAGADVRVNLFTGRGCSPTDLWREASPDVEVPGGRTPYKSFSVQTGGNTFVTSTEDAFCTWTLRPLPGPTTAAPITPEPTTPEPTTPAPTTPAPTTTAPTSALPPAKVTVSVRGGGDAVVVDAPVLRTCYNVQCSSRFATISNENLLNAVGANGATDIRVGVYSAPGCLGRNMLGLSMPGTTLTIPDAPETIQSFSVQSISSISMGSVVDLACPTAAPTPLAPLLSTLTLTTVPTPAPTPAATPTPTPVSSAVPTAKPTKTPPTHHNATSVPPTPAP